MEEIMSESNTEQDRGKITPCNECIIGELTEFPFFQRAIDSKIEIVSRGRLKPNLTHIFSDEVSTNLKGTMSTWYSEYTWLTFCEHINKFFCWPCLLFRRGHKGACVWSLTGFSDVNKFPVCARRHERQKSHINNFMEMKKFKRTYLGMVEKPTQVANVKQETAIIDIDQINKRIIDTSCVEILSNESVKCKNKSSFKTQKNSPFPKADINERIVDSLHELIKDRIKQQVLNSPFYSMSINTISDISNKSFYVVVYRYVTREGDVSERVFKIKSCPKSEENALESYLLNCAAEVESGSQLVSLSFDGGVKASHQSLILKRIKDKYKHVLLLGCYNHRLNLVMQQSVKDLPSCRFFFQTIAKLSMFFFKSKRRKKAYCSVVGMSENETALHFFTTKFLEKLNLNFDNVQYLLGSMFKDKDDWDGITNIEARGFFEIFDDFDFRFLLFLFSRILPPAEEVYTTVNEQMLKNHKLCTDNIGKLIDSLMNCVDNFEIIWNDLEKQKKGQEPPTKKMKSDHLPYDSCKELYVTIVGTISRQAIQRFSSFSRLQFLPLLDTKKFKDFSLKFPEEEFSCLKEEFYSFFDMERLKQQLQDLYWHKNCRKLNHAQLYKYLVDHGSQQTFDQVLKLVAFVLVLPISELKGDSALAKINSYLVSYSRKITPKAVIAMEKDILQQLWTQPSFYDSLMDNLGPINGNQ